MNKLKWVKSLKIGDEVCNCSFKHVKIVKLTPEYMCWMPWLVRKIIFSEWLSDDFSLRLDKIWCEKICKLFNFYVFTDFTIEQANGNSCSAMHCCDPVDHKWDHNEA